jgi:hypothetical protein
MPQNILAGVLLIRIAENLALCSQTSFTTMNQHTAQGPGS